MKLKKSNLNKENRLNKIKHILEKHAIGDYKDIMHILEQEGNFISQPTISRDVKELGYEKNSTGVYVKTKSALLTMKEDLLLELCNQLDITIDLGTIGDNTITLKVPRGYEDHISNLIHHVFENYIIGLFPGYGSILILTTRKEDAEFIVDFFPGEEEYLQV